MKKRLTIWVAVAATTGLLAWNQGAVAQNAPSEQPTDPSMPSSQQQSMPSSETPTSPEPSATDPSTPGAPDTATSPNPPDTSASAAGPSASATEGSTRLAAAVPQGMSAAEACAGFKSSLDCATTLHASQNLNIPFADLKSKVTGGEKLHAAIHDLKPEANAKSESRRAEDQARSDMKGSPQG
jgi:cytoskeletal protein RodZ